MLKNWKCPNVLFVLNSVFPEKYPLFKELFSHLAQSLSEQKVPCLEKLSLKVNTSL